MKPAAPIRMRRRRRRCEEWWWPQSLVDMVLVGELLGGIIGWRGTCVCELSEYICNAKMNNNNNNKIKNKK